MPATMRATGLLDRVSWSPLLLNLMGHTDGHLTFELVSQ